MAASNATKSAGTVADVNPNIIIYRPITWKDVDAVVELFDRTWPQDGGARGYEVLAAHIPVFRAALPAADHIRQRRIRR